MPLKLLFFGNASFLVSQMHLKAGNRVTSLNSCTFCLLFPVLLRGWSLTARTQTALNQKQPFLRRSGTPAASHSRAIFFPYRSGRCSQMVPVTRSAPCSSCAEPSKPFPASCPRFLTHFEQELYSGKAGASEEANVKMKSKGRAVERR